MQRFTRVAHDTAWNKCRFAKLIILFSQQNCLIYVGPVLLEAMFFDDGLVNQPTILLTGRNVRQSMTDRRTNNRFEFKPDISQREYITNGLTTKTNWVLIIYRSSVKCVYICFEGIFYKHIS